MDTQSNSYSIGAGENSNITMGVESRGKEVEVVNKTRVGCLDVVLRVLGLVLTLVAAILLGVDKQTKLVSVQLSPNLYVNVPAHAKWHYLSAFVYFVVANSIVCAYTALSLLLSLASAKSGKRGLAFVITALDLVAVALLFSGGGAAFAVGLIGYQGNDHLQWNKVCNQFDRFCSQVAAAIVLSLIGAVVFLLMILLAVYKLQKKNQ